MSNNGLTIERVPVAAISEDPANARLHPQRNHDAIVASLRRFGQQKPIVVDARNIVRAGNGLLRAAKEIGMTEMDAVRTDLSDIELTAFAIADNRTAELAEWDFQVLAEQFRVLHEQDFNFQDIGWMPHEVEPLLAADWSPPAVGEMPTSQREGQHIHVTDEQHEVIMRAVEAIRKSEGSDEISIGRALELVCADFLAGIKSES